MTDLTRRDFIKVSGATAASWAVAAAAQNPEAQPDMPGSAFEAGVARQDITPEPGVPMWGYSDREGPATGTLDPLYARTVVFRTPEDSIALVTLDLGRVPAREACDRIRDRVAKAGVGRVIFTASHTHQGPVLEFDDAPHAQMIEQRIGDCIEAAAKSLRPARIGVGRTEFDVSHNRRFIKDGKCYMLWRNEERMPTSPLDREAGLIRIDGEDGKPIAVLVNFACHPVVLGPSNLQYSADYVGEMARTVSEQTGAECLFLQGGCGDINPYLDKTPIDQGGVEAMRSVGRACGEAVLAALPAIKTAAPETPSLAYAEKDVTVGTRWDLTEPAVQKFFRDRYGSLFDRYLKDLKPDLAVPLAVLVLNGSLALACMPGEMFVQYQLELKKNSPVANTFLCGYANDFHLYFPTVRDAAIGGYGGSTATYVGIGAGDKLVTEAEIEIGKLAGKLRPSPTPEDFQVVDYPPKPAGNA